MIVYFAGVTYKECDPELVLDEAGVLLSYYEFWMKRSHCIRRMDRRMKFIDSKPKGKKNGKKKSKRNRSKAGRTA